MTEHPGNLAAWLDDELRAMEAERVTRHVEGCADCRAHARSYAEVTGALEGLRLAPAPSRRWRMAAAWAGAIAAGIALAVVLWPRQQTPAVAYVAPPSAVVRTAPTVQVTAPRPVAARRRITRPTVRREPAYAGAVVRVAFPADALFAPGAVPPGVEIYADLLLAADGSARELRLLP